MMNSMMSTRELCKIICKLNMKQKNICQNQFPTGSRVKSTSYKYKEISSAGTLPECNECKISSTFKKQNFKTKPNEKKSSLFICLNNNVGGFFCLCFKTLSFIFSHYINRTNLGGIIMRKLMNILEAFISFFNAFKI